MPHSCPGPVQWGCRGSGREGEGGVPLSWPVGLRGGRGRATPDLAGGGEGNGGRGTSVLTRGGGDGGVGEEGYSCPDQGEGREVMGGEVRFLARGTPPSPVNRHTPVKMVYLLVVLGTWTVISMKHQIYVLKVEMQHRKIIPRYLPSYSTWLSVTSAM